jgi:hypothetical protein
MAKSVMFEMMAEHVHRPFVSKQTPVISHGLSFTTKARSHKDTKKKGSLGFAVKGSRILG